MEITDIISQFNNCACGTVHTSGIRAVCTGSGIVSRTGEILKKHGFPTDILLVADENTIKASEGLEDSLSGFKVTRLIFASLRIADTDGVRAVQERLRQCGGVLSVGTGSLNDICRLAAAREDKPFAIFATAASMDGFASYSAPIIDGGFKETLAAKTPEIIIADTRILASAPDELKSAGFGDMAGKYVALIDWQVSHLVTGEYYCERVAGLTRLAADTAFSLAPQILSRSEETALAVFNALLLTGIAMSFTQTSRPASGTEHILSHYWECKKLLAGKASDYHGKKVGVATLLIMKEYERFASSKRLTAHKFTPDMTDILNVYGRLKDDVLKNNSPPITDSVDINRLNGSTEKIKEIIRSVPSSGEIEKALRAAGCPTECSQIDVDGQLKNEGLRYHPYMRNRVSLFRLMSLYGKNL